MKSAILEEDHKQLVELLRSISPEQRLVAFYNHSRLLSQFPRFQTRKNKTQPSKK